MDRESRIGRVACGRSDRSGPHMDRCVPALSLGAALAHRTHGRGADSHRNRSLLPIYFAIQAANHRHPCSFCSSFAGRPSLLCAVQQFGRIAHLKSALAACKHV